MLCCFESADSAYLEVPLVAESFVYHHCRQDCCFEGFIPLALKSVERGGVVLFFAGASEGATMPATINDIFWRTEVTLTSTYAGSPHDCRTALELIKAGVVPVEKTITHRLGMEEAPEGFTTVCAPVEHECVKVIIEPQR